MQEPAAQQRVSGTIKRVTYHDASSGFCVLKVTSGSQLITITGKLPRVQVGEEVEAQGTWIQDQQYGRQFQALSLRTIPPRTTEGLQKYLSSGLVPGIGAHFAKRLIHAFGDELFDIIEHQPQRLMELDGIGEKRCKQLAAAWQEQRVIRDIMIFLQSHGLGTSRAIKIFKLYGDQAVDQLTRQPYSLIDDLHGIGFKTADRVAQSLGLDPGSQERAMAALKHVAQELNQEGHCLMLREDLITRAHELLAHPEAPLEAAIHQLVQSGDWVADPRFPDHHLQSAAMYEAEKGCATQLQRLTTQTLPALKEPMPQALAWLQAQGDIVLSEGQQEALALAFQNPLCIITGGPGVGKTTLIRAVLSLAKRWGISTQCCAPTGRAAKRMQESTGHPAKTIHRLLAYDPQYGGFKRNEHDPIPTQWLILDEASMVDITLMHDVLKAVPSSCRVLWVGDTDQLPSVGPGSVLLDMIDSQCLPTYHLTQIFRQQASSDIIVNAHRINDGQMPLTAQEQSNKHSDFFWITAETPDDMLQQCLSLISQRLPQHCQAHPIEDIQLLTPMQRGSLGAQALNQQLQQLLNPMDHRERIERYGSAYGVGDKVMQLVNNYDREVFNGDVGFVHRIDASSSTLVVRYEQRLVPYAFSDLDELTLAYAVTIHKSQGSEYPVVVIVLSTQHFTLLERNLLYTAVTRGKRMVVLVAQTKAVRLAVRERRAHRRLTFLKQRLNPSLTTDGSMA